MHPGIVRNIAWASLVCAGTALAQPDQVHKIIHVRVGIDATGHVSDATLVEKKMPAAIESSVLARVKGWTFDPLTANGIAVPAVTFASFDACAVHAGEGFDLSVTYLDDGPLLVHKDRLEQQPVVSNFSKADQSVVAKIKVLEDGRAQLQDVVMVDIDPRVGYDMRLSIKHWVDSMRFTPEQIDGRPVATAMEWKVSFWADNGEEHKPIERDSPRSACGVDLDARYMAHPVDRRFHPRDGAAAAPQPGAH